LLNVALIRAVFAGSCWYVDAKELHWPKEALAAELKVTDSGILEEEAFLVIELYGSSNLMEL
jgi:hypothetical protein